jgi:hypothetical protein
MGLCRDSIAVVLHVTALDDAARNVLNLDDTGY